MTRTEAKAWLISMGIAEPTEDQITNCLNQVQNETQKARSLADKYKAEADKAKDLQRQLDEKDQENLSEVEKATKALETANARIAELEKANTIASKRSSIMAQMNITSEQAKELIDDNGEMNFEVLGRITKEKETASAAAKEQEIAGNQGNPGQKGGSSGEEKTTAEKLVKGMFDNGNKADNSVISHYLGGN